MVLQTQMFRDMFRAEVLEDPANAFDVLERVEAEHPEQIKVLISKYANSKIVTPETFTPDEIELLITYTSDIMFENLDEEIDLSGVLNEEN